MKKITDLTEQRNRTTHHRDRSGRLIKGHTPYMAKRKVKTVKSGPRFAHFFIDFLAFQIIILLAQFITELIQLAIGYDNVIGLTFAYASTIIGLLIYPLMYFVCEFLWQQTPGKFLTKSVVINEYGEKPTPQQIILRSIIRLVPFENAHSYGWHDSWSETFVTKRRTKTT